MIQNTVFYGLGTSGQRLPLWKPLDDMSWEEISAVSAAGQGAKYWSVGDCKRIVLNGKIGGGLTLSNLEVCVFILGFDHNRAREGHGIHFGCFRTALSGGVDIALIDSSFGKYDSSGSRFFNMNHWGKSICGGWKGCDLRYDVLGSTNIPPSGYQGAALSDRTGYDAGEDTATNPAPNTLMAALPADLRAVMRPMTKFTNNVGTSSQEEDITASIDYLPLLSEQEIFGTQVACNPYEYRFQEQYDYYKNGGSAARFRHSSAAEAVVWTARSPVKSGMGNLFVGVSGTGSPGQYGATGCLGLAPVFKV